MKTTLLTGILFFFLGTLLSIAQPGIQWQKSLGGTGKDEGVCTRQTPDGGYIVLGYTESNNGDVSGGKGGFYGNSDIWLARLNAAGELLWQKCLGGTDFEYPFALEVAPDSGYILTGETYSSDGDVTGRHGGFDYWVVKTDTGGTIQWQQCLGGSADDYPQDVKPAAYGGGYYVTGFTTSDDGNVTGVHSTYDFDDWVVKLSSTGTIKWQKCVGGSNAEEGYSMQATTDGGCVVAGTTNSGDGDVTGFHGDINQPTPSDDAWIVKLDSEGILQWETALGGSSYDGFSSVVQTADGGYVAVGWALSVDGDVPASGINGVWMVKLSSTGVLEWQHDVDIAFPNYLICVKNTFDKGFVISGDNYWDLSSGNPTDASDYWMAKTDSMGNIQWQKSFGGSFNDVPYDVQQTSDSGYVLSGASFSNDGDVTGHHGLTDSTDCWIVKLNPVHCSAYFSIAADPDLLHHYIVTNYASGKDPISYTWTWGDNSTDPTPYPSHTYADTGFYDICLSITDANGCTNDYCDNHFHALRSTNTMVTVSVVAPVITTDKEATPLPHTFRIYPNPAANQLTVKYSSDVVNATAVSVYDLLGQRLITSTRPATAGTNLFTVDTHALANGIYLLQLTNGNTEMKKKFVISR